MRPSLLSATLSLAALGCLPGDGKGTADSGGPTDTTPADAGMPEPSAECDEGSTLGRECETQVECSDGCFCNGVELCIRGVCTAGAPACGDGHDCTEDRCDEPSRTCELVPHHDACVDENVCNGDEICVVGRGCRPGLRLVCADGDACTIGSCDPTEGCSYALRDLDGDGFADDRCGGADCVDDPVGGAAIHPDATELCDNGIDDDCDGRVDYRDDGCTAPNDTCDAAELLPGPGSYVRTTRGAADDYSLGCGTGGREAVFRFHLDMPRDVQVLLELEDGAGAVAVFRADACEGGAENACDAGSAPRLLAHALGAGDWYVMVETAEPTSFELTLAYDAPTPRPPVDVCDGDTVEISGGGTFTGVFLDTSDDYALACSDSVRVSGARDAAYKLDLRGGGPKDVRLSVRTSPPHALAWTSLVRDCADPDTTVACAGPREAGLVRRSLEPGLYYVLIEPVHATAVGWTLEVEIEEPLPPGEADHCTTAVDITDASVTVPMTGFVDDDDGCGLRGDPDANFFFTSTETADVELSVTGSGRIDVSVGAECGLPAAQIDCLTGWGSVSQRYLRLAPGTHWVGVSSTTEVTVSARVEPPTPGPPNDECADAAPVTPGVQHLGTLHAAGDSVPSCGPGASPDVFHRLELTQAASATAFVRRTDGSAEPLYVGVRDTADCTTAAADVACTDGNPALLHQVLPAGSHDLVVESERELTGTYSLEVFLAPATPPPAPPTTTNDDCDASAPIARGALYSGTLVTADDSVSSCGPSGSVDAFHRIELTDIRHVIVVANRTDGGAEPLHVGVRNTLGCTHPTSDLRCGTGTPAILDRVLAPGIYDLVVESSPTATGTYSLAVFLAEP